MKSRFFAPAFRDVLHLENLTSGTSGILVTIDHQRGNYLEIVTNLKKFSGMKMHFLRNLILWIRNGKWFWRISRAFSNGLRTTKRRSFPNRLRLQTLKQQNPFSEKSGQCLVVTERT